MSQFLTSACHTFATNGDGTNFPTVFEVGHMSLRERLRRDTRAAHDVVDAAFAHFELSDPFGYQAFLSSPLAPARWQTFCTALSQTPETGREADRIVADALTVFSTYTQAAEHLSLSHSGG